MASRFEHETRSQHNEDLCTYLRAAAPSAFCDWQVTALFYAAVHLVDAYLAATYGLHPNLHRDRTGRGRGRSDCVQQHLRAVYVDYRQLESLSRIARYQPDLPVTHTAVATAEACLHRVKTEVRRRLP